MVEVAEPGGGSRAPGRAVGEVDIRDREGLALLDLVPVGLTLLRLALSALVRQLVGIVQDTNWTTRRQLQG